MDGLRLPEGTPEGFTRTREEGLTDGEAAGRCAGTKVAPKTQEKTTAGILLKNLFSFFNIINFILALALIAVGSYRNMMFMLVVLFNTVIGTVQELRAQRTIEKLKLVNAPRVHVMRGGSEKTITPEEVVPGDIVILRAGDQVTSDGIVVSGTCRAMESLLTGESDDVEKKDGSWVYSGTAVTQGHVCYQAVYTGTDAYASRLTREAKKSNRPASRLMRDMDKLIRVDSILLIPIGAALILKEIFISESTLAQAIPPTVAATLGMIPEGLVLLTSAAMALGVLRLGQKQVLIQELSGIETLSRVDTLCLDKTGTITTGGMTLKAVHGIGINKDGATRALRRFMGAFPDHSSTLDAIRDGIGAGEEKPVSVAHFSSARKNSAATFEDGETLILGAPEFVLKEHYTPDVAKKVSELADMGRRVLVLARSHAAASPDFAPGDGEAIALCEIADDIRPGAVETTKYFAAQGVTLKVISGDDPRTVSRLAREAGIPGAENYVDSASIPEEKLGEAAERYTVFGRVTPERKKSLVLALKAAGHNVAMTGDGVNDIPALKAADCSIAMAAGADATRSSAQVTLLNNDFSAMPSIVNEGRRVVNNITRSASLFLNKTIFSFLLSIGTLIFAGKYPFQPIQLTLVSALTVAFPGVVLALEPDHSRIKGNFLKTVLLRALPGAVSVAVTGMLAMQWARQAGRADNGPTMATYLAAAMGYIVLLRTCRPMTKLRGAMLLAVAAGFVIAVLWQGGLFYLVPLVKNDWIACGILAACGAMLQLLVGLIGIKKR